MTIQLPQSIEAEKTLLGSILLDPSVLTRMELDPDDLYLERHRAILRAVHQVQKDSMTVDVISVGNELRKCQQDDGYLLELITSTVSSIGAESHADIIRDKAVRRRLIQLANELATAAINESSSLDQLSGDIIRRLLDMASTRNGAVHIEQIASRLYDEVMYRVQHPEDVWGIPSGLKSFDEVTGGFQPSELMILSGEPGVGKSRLAMQMAAGMATHTPGAIYSLEMTSVSVLRRLVSGHGQINSRNMKTGAMNERDIMVFNQAIEHFSQLPVWISDAAGWTTTAMRADLARLRAQHGIGWFIVDYLFLLKDGAGLDEIARTTQASNGLKYICRDLGLSCIAVHSMNKAGIAQKGAPGQESLRGSGQVIYDADLIAFLTKLENDLPGEFIPAADKERIRILWFGKGRELDNPKKYIKLVQKDGFPSFYEYAKETK